MSSRLVIGLIAVVVPACLVASCSSSSSSPDGGAGGADAAAGSDGSAKGGSSGSAGKAGTGGMAGTAGTGGGGAVPCGSASCVALEECGAVTSTGANICVPKSVSVQAAEAGTYKIDATEVTYDQYSGWLSTKPACPPTTTGSVCSWKTSYNAGVGASNYPVANVDWCDAYAFCAGIGKRLCGKIGGGSSSASSQWNTTQDQWHNACVSGPANNTYPYGSTYQADSCNGRDYSSDKEAGLGTLPVGSLTACTSPATGYTGTYDMSGNVYEWEDSCTGTAGQADTCRIRGGSYDVTGSSYMQCGYDGSVGRNITDAGIGFRCCGT